MRQFSAKQKGRLTNSIREIVKLMMQRFTHSNKKRKLSLWIDFVLEEVARSSWKKIGR